MTENVIKALTLLSKENVKVEQEAPVWPKLDELKAPDQYTEKEHKRILSVLYFSSEPYLDIPQFCYELSKSWQLSRKERMSNGTALNFRFYYVKQGFIKEVEHKGITRNFINFKRY